MTHDRSTTVPETPQQFPWWVRWLSVFYYLSFFLGPLGFFVLMPIACVYGYRRGPYDPTVISLVGAALACPFLMGCFRAGYVAWGRWRYGDPTETSEVGVNHD